MKNKPRRLMIYLVLVTMILLACATPFSSEANVPAKLTQSAFSFQATGLAIQSQQATLDAALAGKNGASSGGAPTFTPLPSLAPPPTDQPTAGPKVSPTADMKSRIRKANVVIFEDIWGYTPLSGNRRVSMAVDRMGFSGGMVINTGDAYGTFKEKLNSSTKWDLIVVSAESKEGIKGEFYDYIYDQVQKGVGVVIELYNLDSIANGRIAPLLQECGVSFQKDWYRLPTYDPNDYSLSIIDPSHPIFNTPNKNISLVVPNPYWVDADIGDLLRLTGNGDAKQLAGLYQSHKSDYGVLFSCIQERVIIQSFGTHDYRQDQTVPLWMNMMSYALTNHFKYVDEQQQQ